MDSNRQDWGAAQTLLVVPAALHIGLQPEGSFVEASQPIRVKVIVTDLAGGLVAGRSIHAQATRLEERKVKRRPVIEEKETRSRDLVSAGEPVEISFEPGPAGRYRIRASVADDRGRRAESDVTCWVSGKAEPSYRGLVDAELGNAPQDRRAHPAIPGGPREPPG